jgi:predicted phosphodiesterase
MQVIRRAGLIGDVHAEHEALAFAIEQLKRLGAETLLQVGDIVDGAGDVNASIGLLREHRVLAVRGNHERWLLAGQARDLPDATRLGETSPESLDYLAKLPETREFRSPRGNVLLCHGLGRNDMVGIKPDTGSYDIAFNNELQTLIAERRYRFVINGHTHCSMLRTFGQLSIVNAGTLHRDNERAFTYVDFERGELVRFRHVAGSISTKLETWVQDRQVLAESPSEPFRKPFD